MTCNIFTATLFSLMVGFPNGQVGTVKPHLKCFECNEAAHEMTLTVLELGEKGSFSSQFACQEQPGMR